MKITIVLTDFFRQLTDLKYRLVKRGYKLYRYQVVQKHKSFDIFLRDYLVELENFSYSNETERKDKSKVYAKVWDLFALRADLIESYFNRPVFGYSDYKCLLHDFNQSSFDSTAVSFVSPHIAMNAERSLVAQDLSTNNLEKPTDDILSQKLEKVRQEILKYESGEKQPKHIGQRLFGYLLKAGYFNAYNDTQRLNAWKEFTGLDSRPELSYLRDPDSNKNCTPKINAQLKSIEDFFYLIGLDKIQIDYDEKKKTK